MSINEKMQPYVEELEIKHPIKYQQHDGLISSGFDPEQSQHTVYYHSGVQPEDLDHYKPRRPALGSFIHELCHLHLAEQIDPSFAGINVEGTTRAKQLFGTAENKVVDIWVNDLFNEHFPEIFSAHNQNFAKQTEAFIKQKEWRPLLPPYTPHTLSQIEAEAIRHDLPPVDFRRALELAGFGRKTLKSSAGQSIHGLVSREEMSRHGFKSLERFWDAIRESQGEVQSKTLDDLWSERDFLASMPTVSYERSESLARHEDCVNRLATIGKLAITAELVDQLPRPVWYVEQNSI